MTLVVIAPTCRGSGSKIIALEVAIHSSIETGQATVLIDLSTDASPFDFESNCLLAYIYNLIHSSTALRRYDKASNVLITKLVTRKCMGAFRKKSPLTLLTSEDFLSSLAELIQHLTYKDTNVIVYFSPDMLGRLLFEEIMLKRGLVSKSNIIIMSNERVRCLRYWPEHLDTEEVRSRVKSIIINKIPMGVFDNVKEDVLKVVTPRNFRSKSLVVALLPLTMQLYYRNFNAYIPLPVKAELNEHAKTISNAIRRVVRVLLGIESERKLISVIRGMMAEQSLSPIMV